MRLSSCISTVAAAALSLQAVMAAAVSPSTSASETTSSKVPQFHNAARHEAADPYVFYDAASARYYAYSTAGADDGWNFAIYSSPDLATWQRQPGGVLKACYNANMTRLEGGQACWARDWFWAPETYHNAATGWYFFFFAGRLHEDLTAAHFRYGKFEEPSKIGVAVSRSPTGPFEEIQEMPIDYYPFDPDYHDVNLIMDEKQMLPPQTLERGQTAPKGTYIPGIDPNVFFDEDGKIYLYMSRNAYRNWNWDAALGKYIEESNIIVVELEREWWDDPTASTMPEIVASQRDRHAKDAPKLPCNIRSYNGTGEIGRPPRKDGWTTVISYGADPQAWENFHVDDYAKFNGTKKNRRWSEGSTLLKRHDADGNPVYLVTYSCNNYEAARYGVGFATAPSPLGPFRKAATNPVLAQHPNDTIPVFSTGHGSVVASPVYGIGAQDVTQQTPKGAELFYVHHARNDTASERALYTTRMTLQADARVGSDDAIAMHLTTGDQALPRDTYPLRLEARCERRGGRGGEYKVRVRSRMGATFDLGEGGNRVVGIPGEVTPEEKEVMDEDGAFVYMFGESDVGGLAYQRENVDGSWSTIAESHLYCR
ncbi:Glycosyl hydrolase family 43, five-bladed beta-propellor domain protein [Akanthomyces lecanii RCEF 1005]|uniref:Glycosyl hydrolase family 43, five-bladed beta-propellor domain protein n=1 Tax=Akanthomyces lecanii RCEF 1005 TaxID=1081108 RepID=A0A162KMM7_CORDF|nr:Glycosyl hydrolase family 43, five-bladed beta-propellor domain protein [Akanthomyces lecanii RCEF 1005]